MQQLPLPVLLVALLMLFTVFLILKLHHDHTVPDWLLLLPMLLGSLCVPFCMAADRQARMFTLGFGKVDRAQRYQNSLDLLTRAYDLRAVGPLAEAFWLRPMPSGVAGALTRLLRVQAQTAETARLSPRQWQCLIRALTLRGNAETMLQIAALDCLAASGQTRALPAVLKLAHDPACLPTLQTAAQSCLLTLQEQAMDATQRQTLLRPPHIPPAELLRPTSPLAEEAPQQLLRASGHDDVR